MISKKEQIWRYILERALAKKRQFVFEQKKVAQVLGVSTSTVFNALKIPRQSNAIKVTGRSFSLADISKLLTIWATQRKLNKDIIYQTRVNGTISNIEQQLPAGIILGGYTAYKYKFKDAPADYDKVYVYAGDESLEQIKKRFTANRLKPNLFVLRADSKLADYGDLVPASQLYADLWNLPDWYAHDYLEALKQKLDL